MFLESSRNLVRAPQVRAMPLLLIGLAMTATAAFASSDAAVALAKEGRCAAAIPLLAASEGQEALTWLGRCQLRIGDYVGAVASLGAARTGQPADADLALDQAVAHYGTGDLEATRSALADAERLGAARAELPLYQGLLALEDAEAQKAAALFSRARAVAGDAVEPVASYYEGLSHARGGLEAEARQSLERVIAEWPGSEWATAAQNALAGLEPAPLRRWGSLRLGAEYDDNAVLRGRGVVLPREIPDESDERFVWLASAGGEWMRHEAWLASANLTYQGSAHDSLDAFDTHYPTATLWFDRPLGGRWHGRVLLAAGYAWVDGDPFLSTQRGELAAFHQGENAELTRIHAGLYRDDFKFGLTDVPDADASGTCSASTSPCSPFGLDESRERNRDGRGWTAGAEHTRQFERLHLELTGGLRWHAFGARGREYSFRGPELRLSGRIGLPFDWEVTASGAFLHRSFRHPTTFPEPNRGSAATQLTVGRTYSLRGTPRTENETRAEVTLGRNFDERMRFELRWAYQRNRSSAGVFDFDRQQIGAYVTVAFGES
jgi:hypothetical protein